MTALPQSPDRSALRVLGGVAALLLAAVLGLVVGLTGVVWHHSQLLVDGRRWPLGIVLVVLLGMVVCFTLGMGPRRRSLLPVYVLSWTLVTAVAYFPGPGNDRLLADDGLGRTYLVAGATGLLVAVALVTRGRRPRKPSRR